MSESTARLPSPLPQQSRATGQTVAYFAAFVALGLTSASLGPTLPALAEKTHASLSAISFVVAARSLGFLIGSILGGRLYDRAAGHRVMAAMLVAMAVLMATVPVASPLWLLALVMLALGTAESALDVGGNTLLVWTHGSRVGPFMNGMHFFFGVGATVSPIIVAQTFLLSGDVRLSYWTLALVVLPAAVCLARLPGPRPQIISKDDGARQIDYKTVALVAGFMFLYLGAELGFGNWIYSYAIKQRMSAANAAYLTSAFWGSLMSGRLIAIPLAARFKPGSMLLVDLAGCVASVTLVLLLPDSEMAIWIATFGIGFSMASIFPTTLTLAGQRMEITGKVTGWILVGASAGGTLVPWLIGQAFDSAGPRVLMFAILADLIVAAVVLLRLIFHSPRPAAEKA